MENIQLENIFKSTYNFEDWKSLINTLFTNSNFYKTPIESIDKTINYHQIAKSIQEFGTAHLADDKIVKFYDIELEPDKHVTKNRVGLRNLIHNEVIPGDVDAILVVFHTPGDKDWRLTFISKSVFWDDAYNENKLETSARRYTYILGEDKSVKTAVKQFEKLEGEQLTVKHLIELFNVEKINKKFFDDYKKLYNKFWSYLIDTRQYKKLFTAQDAEKQEKSIRDFTKKLLGRIVFLHFLQKKGWMGCAPHPTEWEQGEKQFLLKLLEGFEDKAHFHSKCLTTLFFSTLNAKREGQIFEVEGLNNTINKTKVPYLNGGLFETDKEVNAKSIDFPISYFEELFDFFGQYNFTIDENTPDDHEVGIDPEMLGHIFENLLEDNKDKGAFYTPKEIVQYMTQESLIQYLQTHLGEHYEIENFIRNHDKGDEQAKENFIRDNAKQIEELLDNVKVCDPAIGSGAFPMGMLNEIFKAKMALDWTLERSEVKKSIIQNSIYGVDLESGAVDIARLRFWLALVVDEKDPQALPNLDYKIMQGNSLLESFEGIDLSEIHEGTAIEIDTEMSKTNLFSQELKKKENSGEQEKLEDLIHTYFNLDNPEEKKKLHTKIDQQVLNNIYFTLNDHKVELDKEYKKLRRKIKNKSAMLRTAEQKIKYENDSKDAKTSKKFNIQLEDIASKQLKLKVLYHSNERPFFLWHLMFKEVFDAGGFDIVIGNPPYVSALTMRRTKEEKQILKNNYPLVSGSYDLYILFLLLAKNILKDNGMYSWIIPNKFLIADYAKKTKEALINKGLQHSVNVSEFNVFKGVGVYPIILLGNNSNQNKDFKEYYLKNYSDIITNTLTLKKELPQYKTISDFDMKINAGATGFQAQSLKTHIQSHKTNDSIPFTVSGNVDRYEFNNVKVKFMKGKYENAFVKFNNDVADSKWKFWKSPKIVIAGMTKEIEAVFVESELGLGVGIYGIYDFNGFNPYALTGILNSKYLTYYFINKFKDKHLAGGYLAINKSTIEQFPIVKPSSSCEFILKNLSITIHLLKKQNILYDTNNIIFSAFFEEIIDALVFELYFPENFKKSGIEILKLAEQEFIDIEGKPEEEQKEIILATYQRLTEKKNPLRNQIKLMKIELKVLLNPILSV
jgi:adenine-specific DNA-methyltransferase